MNYRHEAEQRLKDCRDLERSVRNMKRDRDKLMQGPRPLTALPISETGVGGSKEDNTYNQLYQIQTLTRLILETEEELQRVYDTLAELSEDGEECRYYGKILRGWYIEKKPKEVIAEEIGYSSVTTIYTLRNEALRKFAINYFGLKAAASL